ncbi:unnamed protein product [Protopolystoma xenopodis]|uniref:Uncharacterized protein n=1 Tax=Protopolystoma xenopodis TaxID=117903 RepID=A0A448WRK2_9PLAT|nr:unnamed protein product [Protopolystoma xenopodis]
MFKQHRGVIHSPLKRPKDLQYSNGLPSYPPYYAYASSLQEFIRKDLLNRPDWSASSELLSEKSDYEHSIERYSETPKDWLKMQQKYAERRLKMEHSENWIEIDGETRYGDLSHNHNLTSRKPSFYADKKRFGNHSYGPHYRENEAALGRWSEINQTNSALEKYLKCHEISSPSSSSDSISTDEFSTNVCQKAMHFCASKDASPYYRTNGCSNKSMCRLMDLLNVNKAVRLTIYRKGKNERFGMKLSRREDVDEVSRFYRHLMFMMTLITSSSLIS